MTFDKLCKVFLMQEPFYGIILSSLDKIPTTQIDTMGVGKSGSTFKLWYNPDFLKPLDDDTILQLLRHEALHLCFKHPYIGYKEGLDRDQQTHQLYNIACDLEVNCYLDRSKLQKVGGVWVDDYGFDPNLGSLAYYKLLKSELNMPTKMPSSGNSGSGNSDGQISTSSASSSSQSTQSNSSPSASNNGPSDSHSSGTSSGSLTIEIDDKGNSVIKSAKTGKTLETIDSHKEWPDDSTSAEMELLKTEIETLVAFAAEEVEKAQGTVPAEMKGIIEGIRKKPKPVADWKKYCRRYLGNEYTYLTKKSRRRESKRFPDAAGTRHLRKARILVGIDTSGSVSMPEYQEFMGQLLTMKEKANFRVLECDATIQHEYEFNGKISTVLHGGGGTDFTPVVDYFIKHKRDYDCLVYFTDGWCDIPSNTPKDTLWVISSKGDHNMSKYKVNGCSAVYIPKPNNE